MNIAYWHGTELDWDPVAWRFKGSQAGNELLDYERREGYRLPSA
jgi:hypothetical protein